MATEEQIKKLAYLIWENEGHPEGKHMEHYMRAKQILEEKETLQGNVSNEENKDSYGQELKNLVRELEEERKKATEQLVEEHLIAIKQVIEEEKKAIWTEAELVNKSISDEGLH